MIINKIKIKNFRSFEDEVEFNLTPNENKNITLIGGENGAGKSTLFEAIKLCIYGPIIYGYQGFNSNYITKIKSNINYNAFKSENIDVFISVTLTLPEGVEKIKYELKRSWTYENKRLVENFDVLKEGNLLIDTSKDMFENYLKSLIPPNLFDFFFFDGEELSDFFSGKNSSLHLKEAILKLCNYDTLDLLKKQLLHYQRSTNKNSDRANEIEEEYKLASEVLDNLKVDFKNADIELKQLQSNYELLLEEKELLDENFRKSGGLLDSERASLVSKQNALENERENINFYIKDFCNDTLPFLMVAPHLSKIRSQIIAEDNLGVFNNIKTKLTSDIIKDSLLEANIISNTNSSTIDSIPELILNKMFDTKALDNIAEVHQLSNDDKNVVIGSIDKILNNKEELNNVISEKYSRIESINSEIKKIRTKIESSVSEDVLSQYITDNLKLNEKLAEVSAKMGIISKNMESLTISISQAENKAKRCKNAYIELLQSSHSLQLSNRINEAIDEMLNELTKDKIKEIEDNFIKIFTNLIRKDSYVDGIEINNNFEVSLYVNKNYSSLEVSNLIKNIGLDEVEKKYGNKFIDDLMKEYEIKDRKHLLEHLNNSLKFNSLLLRTKVNINGFSKGEKQIFILCLIWSLIKVSGVDIPFIIDTPYARIDESHRNALTNTYLPSISSQVIILSTNEEIDENLYKTVKQYVSNEYLLQYLDKENKTNVINGYFNFPSPGMRYDTMDEIYLLTKELFKTNVYLNNFTDKENPSLSKFSPKLFTLGNIYETNRKLSYQVNIQDEKWHNFVIEFWNYLCLNMNYWQYVFNKQINPHEFRNRYINSNGVVLEALGLLGNYLYKNNFDNWKEYIYNLNNINWSRSNISDWENRVIGPNGRIVKSATHVKLTYNLIKQKLSLSLTTDEEYLEQNFNRQTLNLQYL